MYEKMTANYNVNDKGILKIYDTESGRILSEIWGCAHMSKEDIEELVESVLEELEGEE